MDEGYLQLLTYYLAKNIIIKLYDSVKTPNLKFEWYHKKLKDFYF